VGDRKPFRVHDLLDMDDGEVAVIRYDGDPDVFTALAWARGIDDGWSHTVASPELHYYKHVPDWSGEYGWRLYPMTGPGRGRWLGAMVRLVTFVPDDHYREMVALEKAARAQAEVTP
jgi:hypothetical protein